MRYLARLFLIALALTACGSSDSTPPALLHYVAAQEALAADDLDQARQALQNLVKNASPTLKPLAEKAASACRYCCSARGVQAAVRRSAERPNTRGLRRRVLPNGRRRQGGALGAEGPTSNRQSLLRRFHAPLRRL